VIVVSYEDTAEEILRPRFEAAGADLNRIVEILVPPEKGGALVLPRDLGRLETDVVETGARLVIVDPMLASFGLELNAHRDQDVRVVLAQLAAIAARNDCAAVGVMHLNKNPSKDAYVRISSSTGFFNAARSVVLVVRDPDEPEDHRLVAQVKANWSRRAPIQRHVLEPIELPHIDSETGRRIVTSRMRFVELAEGIDRDSILGEPVPERGERTDAAVVWLEAALSDSDWHDSAGIKDDAVTAGIALRTLQRAVTTLSVEIDSGGFPRTTRWRLPAVAPPLGATDESQLRRGLSDADGATEEARSSSGVALPPNPVAPPTARTWNGPTEAAPDPRVECVICDALYTPGQNGSGPATCPDCHYGNREGTA
jgi:hypothetical protein